MLPRNLVLSALVMLGLSACSTTPLLPPTVKQMPAQSCLTKCDPLTPPADGSDQSVRNWEYQVVEQYGQCRRLHADCVYFITKSDTL